MTSHPDPRRRVRPEQPHLPLGHPLGARAGAFTVVDPQIVGHAGLAEALTEFSKAWSIPMPGLAAPTSRLEEQSGADEGHPDE
jgi:hypothetical protein